MLYTEGYRDTLIATHAAKPGDWGRNGAKYAPDIWAFAYVIEAASVLDYGAGQCSLSRELGAYLAFTDYDPAMPGIDAVVIDNADLVVCTDVMEHVELDCVQDVLEDIHRIADKGVFFVIALKPAAKVLTDGRNAHITLLSQVEWLNEILTVFKPDQWAMHIATKRDHTLAVYLTVRSGAA